MSTITVPRKLWYRLADVIQDMGNHHPDFRGTEKGEDLGTLGNAIKYAVPPHEGASLDLAQQAWVDRAIAVATKYGGIRDGLTPVEGFVETAEKLIGIFAD
ncbi:hypothetical protein [Burkholderia sp. Ac-20365]|uniref:hypothetical protein n=1 Tax=Burkholderia sp. Ac-20365 TaxID=2703897 RepID=UPI00197BDAD1|nr:hypothetical protein [Burkholderia sp. Ac-20365]MBN3761230.1 hypothetical protein [Burkholderia sp. Ac-20365]